HPVLSTAARCCRAQTRARTTVATKSVRLQFKRLESMSTPRQSNRDQLIGVHRSLLGRREPGDAVPAHRPNPDLLADLNGHRRKAEYVVVGVPDNLPNLQCLRIDFDDV